MSNTAISYGINKNTWAGFSKDFQKELYFKLRKAANHMSEGYTKLEDRGFEGLKKAGIEIIIPEPEEKKTLGCSAATKYGIASLRITKRRDCPPRRLSKTSAPAPTSIMP